MPASVEADRNYLIIGNLEEANLKGESKYQLLNGRVRSK
jgi:hypothetical protein